MNEPWDQRLGFWWIAEDHPDHPAILVSPDGPRTYAELAGDAHQLVHLFRHLGAGAGDAIGVAADNGNTLIEASLACQESGMLMIPLNTHLAAAEVAAIMDNSGAKILLIEERLAGLLAELPGTAAPPTVVAIGTIDGVTSLADARSSHPRTAPHDRQPGGVFVYTSGTTGSPKGIRRPMPGGSPDEAANSGALFGRAFDFQPFDGPMVVSTGMFHGGSHTFYVGGLHVGHSLVIMDRFSPERMLGLIEEHRVRTGYMVPTQFHRLLQLPSETRLHYDVSSLHAIVHSAAPCPRVLKEKMMAWWGPVIWETYGGMEGAATIAKPNRWIEKPGTVGRAIRGVRLFILDDDGNELGPGQIGHIYMDNGAGFRYHDDPDQTDAVYRGNRFSLGDIGHLDEDGYLYISDRAKDMIITGGVNVYPAEVEATLLTHPSVYDAAVIGMPDDDWGESVTAVVRPTDEAVAGTVLADALTSFCREHLASYKCPRRVEFRDELPRTEAGKLSKRELRDELISDPSPSGRTEPQEP